MHYFTLNSILNIQDTHKLFITYKFKLSADLTKLAKHYKLGGWVRQENINYVIWGCLFKKQTFILLSGMIQ